MKFIRSHFYKILISCSLIALVGGGAWYYSSIEWGPVYEFNDERDTQSILDLFKSDWYWLVADSPEYYSPEYMLKYRAPKQHDPMWERRMRIKVLREDDTFIGFAAYYMKSPTLGYLNFVAVKPELRGKKHATTLAKYAVDDMVKSGAEKIDVVTRPSNIAARKLYNRLDFEEVFNDGEFVYYSFNVK